MFANSPCALAFSLGKNRYRPPVVSSADAALLRSFRAITNALAAAVSPTQRVILTSLAELQLRIDIRSVQAITRRNLYGPYDKINVIICR